MWRIGRRDAIASGFLWMLLPACSGAATAKKRSFSDVAELRAYVVDALKQRPGVNDVVVDPADPAKILIIMGDRSSTGDVANVFAYLRAYPEEDAEKVLQRFMNGITVDGIKPVAEGDIVPVLRTREYVGAANDSLHEWFGADLFTVYMADRPDSMAPVTGKDLPGKDLAAVRRLALDNLRKWLPKVVSDDSLGTGVLYYVEDNTMLSPSLILLDAFWKSIETRFPGDVLIALPRKDQLFIFDDGPPALRAGIRRLIDVTMEDGANLLSPALYARRGGRIVLGIPPS